MMLYTKYESSGPCSFGQEDFWKLHFENLIFLPCNIIIQPTGKVWTILVGDHPGIIPVKFGQNPMSSFRGEVVWIKKVYTHTHDGQHIPVGEIQGIPHFTFTIRKKCQNLSRSWNKMIT